MNSLLLEISTRYLARILYALAIIFLYKGHNAPGGGFIGGLFISSAIILSMLAYGADATRKSLFMSPEKMGLVGLSVTLFSCVLPVFVGLTFLEGMWLPSFDLPLLGSVHLGTPILFDIGVFMVVISFVLTAIFGLDGAD
jgi:multisubunit Na+/H+ antiporter MnhB subunit